MKDMSLDVQKYLHKSELEYYFRQFSSIKYASLTDEEKRVLIENFDEAFSETFEMPEADFNLDFNSMNASVKEMFPYLKERLGFNVLFAYLFNKREQYQKVCAEEDNTVHYKQNELYYFKDVYNDAPFSGEKIIVERKYGLNIYLANYSKVDAFCYASSLITHCINEFRDKFSREDVEHLRREKNIKEMLKVSTYSNDTLALLDRSEALEDRIDLVSGSGIVNEYYNKIAGSKLEKMIREKEALASLLNSLNSSQDLGKGILVYFEEDIWKNLDENSRKKVIERFSSFMSDFLDMGYEFDVCYEKMDPKDFKFGEGVIYSDDFMNKRGKTIMNILLYEMAFLKYADSYMNADQAYVEELEKCKNSYINGDYKYLKNSEYFNTVNKMAMLMQKQFNLMNKATLKMYRLAGVPIKDDKNKIYDMKKDISKKRR